MDIVEPIIYSIIIFILVSIIIWKLAESSNDDPEKGAQNIYTFFTKLSEGDIKFVVAGKGGRCKRLLANMPGKIVRNNKLVPGDTESDMTFLERNFSLYWVGIPPFRCLHTFPMYKERENPKSTNGNRPDTWIIRDENPIIITTLRGKFPRPVLVTDVECVGGIQTNILALTTNEVIDPITAIFTQKGKFFEVLASLVRSGVGNFCKTLDIREFVKIDKTDDGPMSTSVVDCVRDKILREIGINLISLSIPVYNVSDPKVQEDLEAEVRSDLKGDASIKAAKRESTRIKIEAEGRAEADKIRGVARTADVKSMVEELVIKGVDPNVAATMAAAVGKAQRMSSEGSPVNIWVDGSSNTPISLPPTTPRKKP
jgi:hypothetical protein